MNTLSRILPTLFLGLFLLFGKAAEANVKMGLSLVCKKNVGDHQFVFNEFFETFTLLAGQTKIIQLKYDFKLAIEASFVNQFDNMGPEPVYLVQSKIYKKNGNQDFLLNTTNNVVRSGEKALLNFVDSKGHNFEINFTPLL